MSFESILFKNAADRVRDDRPNAFQFLTDLNFDQIIAAITAGREEYDLASFFNMPLQDADAVRFRHEAMQDLEDPRLFETVRVFASSMRAVRAHLTEVEKSHYELQKQRWFLDAVDLYADAVIRLARDLPFANLQSRAFWSFRRFVSEYASSERFSSLAKEATRLETELAAIRYSIFTRGPHVEVRHNAQEADYSADVSATFERFQQGSVNEYTFKFGDSLEMNHIEAQILAGVAHLHSGVFSALGEFATNNKDCFDEVIRRFDREVQFYVAYLEYTSKLKRLGLSFCYPLISERGNGVLDEAGFDLALAGKLLGDGTTPVCNDFYLKGPERIIVVSGPNQGGKTTFARLFGQLHYLASLGYLVPGTSARLPLPDRIFTHFEKQEQVTNLRGKLEDDLLRIHEILTTATPRSVIIINEIFASTALRDAILLGKRIAAAIMELDVPCVWVTFLDELAALGEKTVSMVSTVVPENPAKRTFKIVRRPADGLAYAMSIAEKYRLTYDIIKERIRS